MKTSHYSIFLILFSSNTVFAQLNQVSFLMFNNNDLISVNVLTKEETYLGKRSLEVVDDGKNAEVKFVKINKPATENFSEAAPGPAPVCQVHLIEEGC